MATENHPESSILVIFGAGGDLTWRKLVPALFNLFLDRRLPDHFAIIGVDRKPTTDDEFRMHLRQGVDRFSRRGPAEESAWSGFASKVSFMQAEFDDIRTYSQLVARLSAQEKAWRSEGIHIFYLATPPQVVETVVQQLGKGRLAHDRKRARAVIEKPFGRDLASAEELNRALTAFFHETQTYRIDHYLGKETVQNLLAFRFANALFEPIWDRRYIDHVQVVVAESVGVEHRGGYYDHAGALRDMIQNHLIQLLCLTAMEPPVAFRADEVRNKKVDVLHAIRPLTPEQVHEAAVRGQYAAGWIQGQHIEAYRAESGVAHDSVTETFAAVKLFVDNWRWQDVPFYLRTGKRLPFKASEVSIQFRPVPHQAFPSAAIENWEPNRLVIQIQPEEGMRLQFQAKRPGPAMHLNRTDMQFRYRDAFKVEPPEAYETLLLDVILGDATLFMRADQIEAAWSVIDPILEVWDAVPPVEFPNYAAGTWGPESSRVLIARDGRSWLPPLSTQQDEKEGPLS